MLCPSCHSQADFVGEAFSTVCSQCGLVLDDTAFDPRPSRYAPGRRGNAALPRHDNAVAARAEAGLPPIGQHKTAAEWRFARTLSRERDLLRFLRGLVGQLGYPDVVEEVSRLLFRLRILAVNLRSSQDERAAAEGSLRSYIDCPRRTTGRSTTRHALQQMHAAFGADSDDDADGLAPASASVSIPVIRWGRETNHVAAAAVFAVLKQRNAELRLEDVCNAAGMTLKEVARRLTDLETVLGDTPLLAVSYDTPEEFVDYHIAFLQREIKLTPRQNPIDAVDTRTAADTHRSIFSLREHTFVSQARVSSKGFHDLAHDLAALCADKGLRNRSSRSAEMRARKDMSLCAWAIVMLALEGQTRKTLAEDNFARAAAWAPGWDPTFKTSGFGRAELGLFRSDANLATAPHLSQGRNKADAGDLDFGLKMDAARASTIASIQVYVKMRYMEIRRMLTLIIRTLPWLDNRPFEVKGARRNKKLGKVRGATENVRSIAPLPRAEVAQSLRDALRLRHMLPSPNTSHQTEVVQDDGSNMTGHDDTIARAGSNAVSWSDFWSTETTAVRRGLSKAIVVEAQDTAPELTDPDLLNHAVRASFTEDRDENAPAHSAISPDFTSIFVNAFHSLVALDRQREDAKAERNDGHSRIALRVGPTMADLASLESMSGEVVDRLLFAPQELEGYFRTPAEIDMVRRARVETGGRDLALAPGAASQKDTFDTGDASATESLRRTREIETERDDGRPPKKRTRAMDEAAFERLLASL